MGRRPYGARRYVVPVLVAALIAGLGTPPRPAIANTTTPQNASAPAVNAEPEPTVVVPFEAPGYRYLVVSPGGGPADFMQPGFGDSAFSTGAGGFGSGGGCAVQGTRHTNWPTNTDILIRKTIDLPPNTTDVTIIGGIDNDLFIYWNGELLGQRFHEGCPTITDFTVPVPQTSVVTGNNVLAIRARDRGVESWVDVKVLATLHPLTTPTAVAGPDQSVVEGSAVTLNGMGSSDPSGAPLSYSWVLAGQTGPPITLSSSTSPTPTFQTLDDGVYRFELTVSNGTESATDEVVVTVTNAVPILSVQADPAYEKSVALITTTFTDAGILDTHHGVLNWGDGSSPDTVPVAAQGSGWGTLVASHVYANAGSFSVAITVADDDGGEAITTLGSFSVVVPVAIWANSNNSDAAMETTSGAATFEGLVHTNDDLRIRGGAKVFRGPVEYVRTLDVGGSGASFDPPPVQTAVKPLPLRFDIADYRPAGRAAVQAGAAYHNMSSSCANGVWQVTGSTLTSGIYYATCAVKLNGNPLGGTITIASEGDITVSGSGAFFDPFVDGLLFLSASTSTSAIRVDAASSTFFGYSYADHGRIVLTGANDKFYCGIISDRIDIASQGLLVHGSACSRPARSVAPPTIVPALSVDLTVDKANALPRAGLTHTATVTNTGSTVVVPGILGLENLGAASATVTGHVLALEYLSATDNAWHPLPGAITTNVRPNVYPGVTYPGGANSIDGATIPAGALASWGYAAVVSLTAAETALLLNPAQVGAIRVSSTFTLNPNTVPVRRLFRFGDDFAGQLRTLGADATNVNVTIVPPAGDARVFGPATTPALATLVPGESVALAHASTVPVPAPRGATESDAAYLARLAALDSTPLVGTAFGRGTAGIGPVLAPAAVATTTRHLPVVALDKTGPIDLEPGSTAAYDLALSNGGSAEARAIVVSDALTGIGSLPVSAAPTVLAPAASAIAHASYAVPTNITNTTLANTGTVRWTDAGGNAYGPVNDSAATRLISARKLVVTKTDAASTSGGQFLVDYDISITNVGAQTITGANLTDHLDPYTTLVAGSVRTSQGTITTGSGPEDVDVAVAVGTVASGGTVSIGFRAALTGSVPEGMNGISNQANVTSDQLDPVLSDDPEGPGATDPTITAVVGTGGGGGGGGGELAHPSIGTTSPGDGTVITEPTDVSAEITPADGFTVASWSILVRPAGAGADTVIATQTVTGGGNATASGTVDPTKLPNGTYLLTIRAVSSDGGVQNSTTSLIVDGNLKLGRYVTTYQDLSVGVAGLPMQVLRTYDSFDKTVGDFGVGWNVDLANFRVSVNKPLGYGGWVQETFGCGFIFCQTRYRSTTPHTVTVVWPDGHQEIFDMTPANGSTFFAPLTAAGFTGRARTTSKLEADGDTGLSFFGDGNLYGGGFGSGGIFDPQRFRLTAKDGTVYLLDRTSGLVSSTDRNGNTLTVSAAGITSSLGPSITFTRDAQGRITKVVGPEDETLLYTYDPAGDLKTATDPTGRILTYTYDGAHNLTLTKDPLNRPFQTLTYQDGRLATVTDALGNEVTVDLDPDARTETVIDPEGRRTTFSTFDARGNTIETKNIYDGKTAITSYTYDAFDNVKTRRDPNGKTWTGVYDEQRLRFLTDPTSKTTEIEYDQFGYPILWTQPRGGETEYHWDNAGNLTSIVNPFDDPETYTYLNGNRVTRTDREGHTWTYDWFADRTLKSTTDPLSHTTSYTYDDSGRLLTETDATNRVTTYAYWPDGNLKSISAPGGLVTSYTYNDLGLLATRTDEAGKTTRWDYDAAGRVRKKTDALLKETLYTYDRDGRLETTTAPDGGITRKTYDGLGHLATVTDPVGRVTEYTYDLGGRLISTENPADGVTEFEYDNAGRLTVVRDPLGNEVIQTHDADGNLATVLDPLLHLTRYDHDLAGRLFKVTDAALGETTTAYDRDGRIVGITNPEHETTQSGYDAAGRLVSVKDGLGHETTYGYDNAGRLASTTDPLGHATTMTFDTAGRVATETTASGITTTYTYDPRGMVATARNPLNQTTTYTYDDAGRLATQRDARNFTTTFTYDAVGRLKTIKDPKNAVVTLGYNLAGDRTSITDPRGKTWSTTYDVLGGIKTTTDPLGRGMSLVYNDAGQLKQRTDARGVLTTYDYDDAGNLDQLTAGPIAITYTQDALNRRKTAASALGTTTWSYDGAGRVTSVVAPAGSVGYTYDDAGRRSTMSLPSGTVTYGYSDDNRLTSLTGPFGAFGFTYFADGRSQTLTRPNGVTTTDGYDAAGRLNSVTHTRGATTLATFTYGLDPNGNRTSMASATGTETYTINELNQLTRIVLPGGATTDYTYDTAGSRATKVAGGSTTTYTYDDASQLTSVGGAAYTYDASGNRLTGGGTTFTWDSLGRLASATSGGLTTTYGSDGDGRRVSATTAGTTTPYLWDVAGGLDELVSDGTRSVLQVGGDVLAERSAGATVYPLLDALGSVRVVTDNAGNGIGTASYDAFGAQTAQSGASSAFGFAGEQRDASGIYLRSRTLDPTTGIFLQTDPVRPGAAGVVGYNPYSYVGNNPSTLTDPSGRFAAEYALQETEETGPTLVALEGGKGLGIPLLYKAIALIMVGVLVVCTVICILPAPNGQPQPAPGQDGAPQPGPGTGTNPGPNPPPQIDPGPDPGQEPEPDPDEDPKRGETVFRVYGNDAKWSGGSWTPIDPRGLGPDQFRIVAGLPDRLNSGQFLVIGILVNPELAFKQGSRPVSPAEDYGWDKYRGIGVAYCTYPGGLPEYIIPNAAFQVRPIALAIPLIPPYGGRPAVCPDGTVPPP